MRTSVTPWFAALGAAVMTLTLSGCFGGPPAPALPGGGSAPDDDLVEEIVEGSGDGIDFESGALPDDFPVDAVPLVPGQVLTGISVSQGQAWTVTIVAADRATAETADDLLQAAGYSNDSGFGWENEDYLVIIVATQEMEEGGWAVHYQVQVQQ